VPLSNREVSRQESRPSLGSGAVTKRSFSREFKLHVVRQLVSGEKRFAQLCREHNLCQTLLRRWREQYDQRGENAWLDQDDGRRVDAEAQTRIAALEAALGRATLENEFLRHALQLARKGGSVPPRNGR
jgi:transposase